MASNQVDVKAVITADDRASAVMSDFSNNTRKATTAIAAAMTVAGAGLTLFTKNATDYTVELTKNTKALGRETGLTAESASALLYVTQRMGVSAEETQQIFGIFSKQIAKTAQAVDPTKTALGALGIAVKDSQGYTKDFNTILLDTADKFKSLPDGAQKTADAMAIFGRSGKDLIPVLDLGSQGIKDMEAQAQKLGLTLTTENVVSVTKYIQATKNLTDSQNALKVQIGELTAPVLANLDNKLASVLNKMISASGPFHGLAASAIAVSGPLLSVGGAVLGVAANLEQALPLITAVGGALVVAAPYILAVGAAIGIGAVAWKVFKDRTNEAGKSFDDAQDAAHRMNTTLQNQVTTLHDVTQATKDLTRANEDVTGAQLNVEQAQKDYNQAVKDYGVNSLQAREAAHQVTEAQFGLQDATDKAATAQDTLNQKQADMAIQAPSASAAIGIVAGAMQGITLAADTAITHVADLSLRIGQTLVQSINATGVIQGQFSSLQGAANTVQVAVNTVQTTANNLQTTINNLNTSGSRGIPLNVNVSGKSIPLRAEGGPVQAGQPYWVGEEGIPELFVPKQSGTIVPKDKMSSSGGSSDQTTRGNTTINVNVNAQAFMGSQVEARKFAQGILNALQDIALSRNTTLQQMVGG